LIVLINKGSASGSEILAGAIKDNARGLILGERSFGKASVQTIIPLKDESAVRLTTAHYYTPNGSLIHEKGIDPDIDITEVIKKAKPSASDPDIDTEMLFKDIDEGKEGLSLETKEQEALEDSILEQAIDLMKGLIKFRTMLSGS
ncbi:MAG: S41 family peptidase, partial [Candidatus Omnitrophica bacterium]|nr:S41 family peptidase [Candidatus Omnitrophota bacterium]